LNIKNFFKRISKEERGDFGLTVFLVSALITASVLCYSLSKYGGEGLAKSEEQNQKDPVAMFEGTEKFDANEELTSKGEVVMESAKKLLDTAAGTELSVIDNTNIVPILYDLTKKDTGTGEVKVKEPKNNNELAKPLEDAGIPTDPVTLAVADSVNDITNTNASPDATQDEIKNTTVNIVGELWKGSAKTLENVQNNIETLTKKSSEVLDTVKEKLEEQKILAEKEIVEKKLEYDKCQESKKFLEEAITEYKEYEDEGYIIASGTSEYANLQERLDEVNNKIETVTVDLENSGVAVTEESTSVEESVVESTAKETTSTAKETTSTTSTEETVKKPQGSITLYGSFGTSSMTMTINLDTGRVSGSLHETRTIKCHQDVVDQDGKVIDKIITDAKAELGGSISGSMNLETKSISGSATASIIIAEGPCAQSVPTQSCSFSGSLSSSNSSASGTVSDGDSWRCSK